MPTATRTIGLLVDTVGSYGREVLYGVMEFCHRNPHWVVAIEPRMWHHGELTLPAKWNVDGMIVQAHRQEIVDRIRASGTPAINVANMRVCRKPLPTIVPDDPAIGRMAAEYLLSLDMPHYALCGHAIAQYSQLRRAAYKAAMRRAGKRVAECDGGTRDLGEWVAGLPRPTAVFCVNDDWAHRVLSAARQNNLRVPDDLAVLGVDDDELLNTIGAMPFSSIAIPAAKVGFQAARLLEDALNGRRRRLPAMTKLPPLCVVPRATTDVANAEDAKVSDAMRYIKANVARPIQVGDVLEHVSMSRRTLERRFRDSIGRSIAGEIRRAHVERAKQLLTNTTLAIEEVARASGFTNVTLLGVVFRRHVGDSPSGFRARSTFTTIPPRTAGKRRA